MPPKKPPFSPLTTSKPAPPRPSSRKSAPPLPKAQSPADRQWQRSKRYGWDSR